jgi:6-phosphogluconolactonase
MPVSGTKRAKFPKEISLERKIITFRPSTNTAPTNRANPRSTHYRSLGRTLKLCPVIALVGHTRTRVDREHHAANRMLSERFSLLPGATQTELSMLGASWIAGFLRATVAEKGRATMALSGGRSPGPMFSALASEDVPWDCVHVLQVDERLAADNDPDRNLTGLTETLLDHINLAPANLHPMRVSSDLTPTAMAADYARLLDRVAPDGIDLVQLGLGDDGHTASLVPGDSVLGVYDKRVSFTGEYQNRMRLTLTFPELKRCGAILWFVPGATKTERLQQLVSGDRSIPAGNIRHERQTLVIDASVAAVLQGNLT